MLRSPKVSLKYVSARDFIRSVKCRCVPTRSHTGLSFSHSQVSLTPAKYMLSKQPSCSSGHDVKLAGMSSTIKISLELGACSALSRPSGNKIPASPGRLTWKSPLSFLSSFTQGGTRVYVATCYKKLILSNRAAEHISHSLIRRNSGMPPLAGPCDGMNAA